MAIVRAVIAIAIFFFCGPTDAFANRVAFVMGVDQYDHLEPLKKAVGDARAVKAMLEARGDTMIVAYLENPTRNEFWKAWDAFLARVREGDEAFVHISSHGIEIDGINYLLPRDAPDPERGQRIIQQEAIRFGELLANVSGKGPRISLFVLDACRNNPYHARGLRDIGGERGLARVDPPEGAFVLYSAGINQTALDRLSESDPVATSVYMRTLLPLLTTPGLKIQDVATQVRGEVYDLAAKVPHKQSPTYYDNIIGRTAYCFAGCDSDGQKVAANVEPKTISQPGPQIQALQSPTIYLSDATKPALQQFLALNIRDNECGRKIGWTSRKAEATHALATETIFETIWEFDCGYKSRISVRYKFTKNLELKREHFVTSSICLVGVEDPEAALMRLISKKVVNELCKSLSP